MRTRPLAPVLSASLLLGACAPADPDDSDTATSTGEAGTSEGGGPAISEPPTLTEPCVGELQNPTRLAITTTDFSTGALSVLDLNTGEVKPDLALATTDSLPFYSDGRLVLLHRYTFDALDLLSPTSFALLGQQSLAVPGVLSSNPHAIAIAGDLAYVTLFGAPRVQIVDLADPSRPTLAGHIDLGPLADADGNPVSLAQLESAATLWTAHFGTSSAVPRREVLSYLRELSSRDPILCPPEMWRSRLKYIVFQAMLDYGVWLRHSAKAHSLVWVGPLHVGMVREEPADFDPVFISKVDRWPPPQVEQA